MKKGKTTKAVRATADVVRLPGPSFEFDAYDIDEQFLARYDAERVMMVIVEGILKKNHEQLKRTARNAASAIGVSLGALDNDIDSSASGWRALAGAFECAAARIRAVEARLV